MIILKDKTKSICPICFNEIDAKVIELDKNVFLLKECPEHGQFRVLIEKDAAFYKRLMNKGPLIEKMPLFNVVVAVTHECNLHCNVCYLPQRDGHDLTFEELKKIILDFEGKEIVLSGGEPTMREDLPAVIEFIVKNGKNAILVTNGLRLTDIIYVKRLKNAGVTRVYVSFNAFNDDSYKEINGEDLLKSKLKILKNLKKENVPTLISVMIVKGVNEKDLDRIYRYCIRNLSFVKQLRIRSSVHIGRYTEASCIYLSEMVKMVSKIIGINVDAIISHSIELESSMSDFGNRLTGHKPCHIEIDLFSLLMKEVGINAINNSISKKILAIFRLLPRLGIINIFKMIKRKLKGEKRLLDFGIGITTFPDKYRIDLGEMELCHTGHLIRSDKTILPFCHAIILNEKDNNDLPPKKWTQRRVGGSITASS